MSPRGSQRNFGSPGLVKRTGTALQHLKPGEMSREMSGYQKNIWSNPFQSSDESQSYLQRLQAQQFPHIVPKLKSLEELETAEKMETYENPSEHYAAIKYGEAQVGGVQSVQPLLSTGNSASGFGSHLLHPINSRDTQSSSVNFYGYGKFL